MLNWSFKFFRGVINRGHERWHCSGAVYRTVARSELNLRDEIYEEIISNNHKFANCKQLSECSSKFQLSTHLKIIRL
jgi:hypothetical protein